MAYGVPQKAKRGDMAYRTLAEAYIDMVCGKAGFTPCIMMARVV